MRHPSDARCGDPDGIAGFGSPRAYSSDMANARQARLDEIDNAESSQVEAGELSPRAWDDRKRANALPGKEWTRNSISIWSDVRKNDEERVLAKQHPAVFPEALVRRAMDCFMAPGDTLVLDPFAGTGSTIAAAQRSGRTGIGFEIYGEYAAVANARLGTQLFDTGAGTIVEESAVHLLNHVEKESVDFVFTSPPYWNVLGQKRTADNKSTREYGAHGLDLGRIDEYDAFVSALGGVFEQVYLSLKTGKYCIVNVMDLRKGSDFYPLHSDLAIEMVRLGFVWDDLIIWDRRHEYNNMRPLGYPSVFRINKAHEYLLIFQKRS